MKTILKSITYFSLFFTSSFVYAQQTTEIHEDDAHRIEQTVNYTLGDFDEKYYTIFKESYQNYKGIKQDEVKANGIFATTIDFENGEKEQIAIQNGQEIFSVFFDSAMEEEVALKLKEMIISRVLARSPKGFEVKTTDKNTALNNEATLIVYNTDAPEKSAHQPTILIWIDRDTFAVHFEVIEPLKKA